MLCAQPCAGWQWTTDLREQGTNTVLWMRQGKAGGKDVLWIHSPTCCGQTEGLDHLLRNYWPWVQYAL